VLLWAAGDAVDPEAWKRVELADAVYVSAASVWEIEIKRSTGRLPAPADLAERALQEGFLALPITFEHARLAGRLPPVHRDPFDRMLVAQAQAEGMMLATADAALGAYGVPLLSVSRAAQ